MKKLFLVLSIFVVLITLSSCIRGVTAVAYTRFEGDEGDYLYYSSDAYGMTHGQIEVYKSEEEFNATYSIADIEFRFSRCLGADVLDDYKYTLVDLSHKPVYVTIYIYKLSDRYSQDKSIYINGKVVTPSNVYVGDTLLAYTYENLSLKRTNPNGKIKNDRVNVIEYK